MDGKMNRPFFPPPHQSPKIGRWVYPLSFIKKSKLPWFPIGTIETCQSEVFEAQCSEDEVILMQVALFGRMEIGRCVESDLGYIGCKADVLPYLHR